MMNTTHKKYDAPGKNSVGFSSSLLSSSALINIVSNSNSPVVITRVLIKALPGVENGVNSPYNRVASYKGHYTSS